MAFTKSSDFPSPPRLNDNDQYSIAMDSIVFEMAQMLYNFKPCSVCNEYRLEMKPRVDNVCQRCFVDKNQIKMFSFENKIDQDFFQLN